MRLDCSTNHGLFSSTHPDPRASAVVVGATRPAFSTLAYAPSPRLAVPKSDHRKPPAAPTFRQGFSETASLISKARCD